MLGAFRNKPEWNFLRHSIGSWLKFNILRHCRYSSRCVLLLIEVWRTLNIQLRRATFLSVVTDCQFSYLILPFHPSQNSWQSIEKKKIFKVKKKCLLLPKIELTFCLSHPIIWFMVCFFYISTIHTRDLLAKNFLHPPSAATNDILHSHHNFHIGREKLFLFSPLLSGRRKEKRNF